MKDIRIGNDIAVTWTVTSTTAIDLSTAVVKLYNQFGEEATISGLTKTALDTKTYEISFTFYGKDQSEEGIYRIFLQKNKGTTGMITLDKIEAFNLVGVSDFGIVSGEDDSHISSVIVELTTSTPSHYYTKDDIDDLLSGKQDELTFDDVPTEGSSNPVKSGGVYSALQGKQDTLQRYSENGSGYEAKINGSVGTVTVKNDSIRLDFGSSTSYVQVDGNGVKLKSSGNGKVTYNEDEVLTTTTVSGKADKVANATANNFAKLGIDGNLLDSGVSPSDYYKKQNLYTKGEVNGLISSISQFSYEVVSELPTASEDTMNKIYLVPSASSTTQNVKDEYITLADEEGDVITYSWEKIGSTAVDLSGYYTKTQTDSLLSAKQNTLTFDSSPTNNSANPVTSGGVYTALLSKQNALTFDNTPQSGSSNPVKSGGVYSALSGKQNTLTFDSIPQWGSDNPVKSNGIKEALMCDAPSGTSYTYSGIFEFRSSTYYQPTQAIHLFAGDTITILNSSNVVTLYMYDNTPTTFSINDAPVAIYKYNSFIPSQGTLLSNTGSYTATADIDVEIRYVFSSYPSYRKIWLSYTTSKKDVTDCVEEINPLIPSEATSQNKLTHNDYYKSSAVELVSEVPTHAVTGLSVTAGGHYYIKMTSASQGSDVVASKPVYVYSNGSASAVTSSGWAAGDIIHVSYEYDSGSSIDRLILVDKATGIYESLSNLGDIIGGINTILASVI